MENLVTRKEGSPVNVSSATGPAGILAEASITMLRKTLDMATDQNAQLLKALPQAPGPGHLGGGVDLYM